MGIETTKPVSIPSQAKSHRYGVHGRTTASTRLASGEHPCLHDVESTLTLVCRQTTPQPAHVATIAVDQGRGSPTRRGFTARVVDVHRPSGDDAGCKELVATRTPFDVHDRRRQHQGLGLSTKQKSTPSQTKSKSCRTYRTHRRHMHQSSIAPVQETALRPVRSTEGRACRGWRVRTTFETCSTLWVAVRPRRRLLQVISTHPVSIAVPSLTVWILRHRAAQRWPSRSQDYPSAGQGK